MAARHVAVCGRLVLEMRMTTEAEVVALQPTETEVSESIQAGYDRIANPEKAQEEPVASTAEPLAAETPKEPAFDSEQIKAVMAQVSRIPDLEKQLRDAGGRYGAIKQSLDQLQQRMAAPTSGNPADVEDMLKDIKDEFGEDGLYQSLKSAFSKLAAGRQIDPSAIEKMVSEKIAADKQAEHESAIAQLTEAHPNWMQNRETPEFKDWVGSLPEKTRNRFWRSNDPEFLSEKLDDFEEWKAKKAAPPQTEKPAPKSEPEPSKRLMKAVLPTNGTKPKATAGEDDKATAIRAAYERVAGARLR